MLVIKCYDDHKKLFNDRPLACGVTLGLLAVGWLDLGRVVASWSSIFESVEWNTAKSIEKVISSGDVLG